MSDNLEAAAPVAPALSDTGPNLYRWQARLLPLMASALVLLTIFCCVFNVIEARHVLQHIEAEHEIDLKPQLSQLDFAQSGLSPADRLVYVRWETLSMLEVNALESRYHQASILVMTRVYLVFLGFATGMVLAIVGATFILGKLRESESRIGGGGSLGSIAISSASPGLVLACFGTILMLTTILSRFDVAVSDRSLYVPDAVSIDASRPVAVPITTKTDKVVLPVRAPSTPAQTSILEDVRSKMADNAGKLKDGSK